MKAIELAGILLQHEDAEVVIEYSYYHESIIDVSYDEAKNRVVLDAALY